MLNMSKSQSRLSNSPIINNLPINKEKNNKKNKKENEKLNKDFTKIEE